MQINVNNINSMMQDQIYIYQICSEHPECKKCPIKEKGYIQANNSIWSCQNAVEIQR
jgi:hypothetical protein